MEIAHEAARGAALGDEAPGQAFQHAAHVDGIDHLAHGECAHHIAARAGERQQALLRQRRQRLANRRARHAETLGDVDLGDALAGHELAAQDHLAQPDGDAGLLRRHRAGHV